MNLSTPRDKQEKASGVLTEAPSKQDLKQFQQEIIHEFHVIFRGLTDQMKLLAEGHSGIIDRLGRMEQENERQHQETRVLVKISFSELHVRHSFISSF